VNSGSDADAGAVGGGGLPTGTVTFLFTDVEGSTRLWELQPAGMRAALARHDQLIEQLVERAGGLLVRPRGEGDSRFAVFDSASAAVLAAVTIQRSLQAESWPLAEPLRVRMALHTGEADLRDGDYYGSAPNRCARLRGVAYGGQVLVSASTAVLVRDQLPPGLLLRDLGIHRLKDLTSPEHVFQLIHHELLADFPPLGSFDARPYSLPVQATPLVGREAELAAITRRLRSTEVRLLTLTGAGGIGKTRLALQAAAELLDDYAGGVFFVTLAPIAEPSLLVSAIAQALGLRDAGGSLRESLRDFLRDKQLLLVLDNFEHLLQAVSLVPELLAEAPGLNILVTSREVLRVGGEHCLVVPPLRLPPRAALPPLEQLTQYEAVRLFIERAQAVKSDFQVSRASAPAVAKICHQLDGLPLAIELAAARVRHLAPETLLVRLEHRLSVLTAGARDLPARQQTLRGAIDWSYDLLTSDEQALFCRLAVFAGGCTLDAAEKVCGAGVPEHDDLLALMGQLVDKSLLNTEDGAFREMRYRLLEPMREYAQERLISSATAERTRQSHATYFADLAMAGDPDSHFAYGKTWLERMEQEHDNVRAALSWCLSSGAIEVGLRLCRGVVQFWYVRGYMTEGCSWLERLLPAARGTAPSTVHVDVLTRAGDLLRAMPAYARANDYFTEALELATRLHYARGMSAALDGLGVLAAQAGHMDLARANYEQALALAEGQPLQTAAVLIDLGDLALARGDVQTAEPYYERSASLQRGIANSHGLAVSLARLGRVALERNDYVLARERLQQSAVIRQELGGRRFAAISLLGISQVALAERDLAEAAVLAEECLEAFFEMGRIRDATIALDQCAAVVAARGQPERALCLFAAAAAQRAAIGFVLAPHDQARLERCLVGTRAGLDERLANDAWARGLTLNLQMAVAEVGSLIPNGAGPSTDWCAWLPGE